MFVTARVTFNNGKIEKFYFKDTWAACVDAARWLEKNPKLQRVDFLKNGILNFSYVRKKMLDK